MKIPRPIHVLLLRENWFGKMILAKNAPAKATNGDTTTAAWAVNLESFFIFYDLHSWKALLMVTRQKNDNYIFWSYNFIPFIQVCWSLLYRGLNEKYQNSHIWLLLKNNHLCSFKKFANSSAYAFISKVLNASIIFLHLLRYFSSPEFLYLIRVVLVKLF